MGLTLKYGLCLVFKASRPSCRKPSRSYHIPSWEITMDCPAGINWFHITSTHKHNKPFSRRIFWHVMAGRALTLIMAVFHLGVPVSQASKPECTIAGPWHQASQWDSVIINVISYTCVWKARMCSVIKVCNLDMPWHINASKARHQIYKLYKCAGWHKRIWHTWTYKKSTARHSCCNILGTKQIRNIS